MRTSDRLAAVAGDSRVWLNLAWSEKKKGLEGGGRGSGRRELGGVSIREKGPHAYYVGGSD